MAYPPDLNVSLAAQLLTPEQRDRLERNPEYQIFGKECPVCMGTGKYRYLDEEFDCPDNDYGHVMLQRAKLYWSANIGLQYQTLDWQQYPHPDVAAEVEDYIEKYPYARVRGLGATFSSVDLGVGKTWGATHILKELVKRGVDGWFVPYWELGQYKDWEDDDDRRFRVQRVRTAELLVLDDIKEPYTHRMQEYKEDKLEEFLRPRQDRNLPTIVTTNMPDKLLEEKFPRVASLLSAKNIRFEVSGSDARMDGTVYQASVDIAMNSESCPII